MTRSHLTQALLNYFDETDARVRETANTLDAQLLNTAALSLEEHQLRVRREIGGRFLATCPVNLDNQGVYYRAQIPVRFPLTSSPTGEMLPPSRVTGKLGDVQIPLPAFTDTLLAPAAVEHAGDPIILADPKLATLRGAATVLPTVSNLRLPIPNRLSFWVQGMQELQGFIVLIVEGRPFPQSLWPGLASTKSETLIFSSEGLQRTNTVWASIDRVSAYGLPDGGTVDIYALEMCLPFTPDPARPYTHPAHRDAPRPRYWQIDNGSDGQSGDPRLNEVYYENSEQGFPTGDDPAAPPLVTSYRIGDTAQYAIAVEPNTWGMIAVRESRTGEVALDYIDRRESMPDNLARAGLTMEPQWGLNVKFDENSREVRQVILQASPYVSADLAQSWRYVVEQPGDPTPRLYSWVAEDRQWEVVEFNPSNWNSGNPPAELAFPLGAGPGSYLFTLETRTPGGAVVHDSFPYADLQIDPKATLDLDLFTVRGVAFDYRQRLWIWDGTLLHPMRLLYDGYIFDPASRSLYLTRPYDEITIQ